MEALEQVDQVKHGQEGDRYVQVAVLTGTQLTCHGNGEGVEIQKHLRYLEWGADGGGGGCKGGRKRWVAIGREMKDEGEESRRMETRGREAENQGEEG